MAANIYKNAGYAISPYGYIMNKNRWKRIIRTTMQVNPTNEFN